MGYNIVHQCNAISMNIFIIIIYQFDGTKATTPIYLFYPVTIRYVIDSRMHYSIIQFEALDTYFLKLYDTIQCNISSDNQHTILCNIDIDKWPREYYSCRNTPAYIKAFTIVFSNYTYLRFINSYEKIIIGWLVINFHGTL